MDLLKSSFPIITWLPSYNGEKAIRDLIAGLTVGLTVIPQGLAYAVLAGLPTQYGLYSSFMGVFIYSLLGTSKDITLGPTAIMSMLVARYCMRPDSWPLESPLPETSSDPILAVNLTFLTGVILVVLGLFNLGFLVNFISHAIIVGFCSAASIVIAASQLKKIFGIKLHHREFFHMMPELGGKVMGGEINWVDFGMGLSCLVILKSLELLKRRYSESQTLKPFVAKLIWLVGTARNAIVVIFAATLAYVLEHDNIDYWKAGCQPGAPNCTKLTLTKIGDSSMPGFNLPKFNYQYETINGTNHDVPFVDILSTLSTGLFIVPLMAYLESISIAKGFSIKNNYKISANQELLAIGASNAISALVCSYPVTGSFSRTAVNSQSNVATPAGGIVCGLLVLLAALFLTPIFVYIPAACLGAVIVLAAVSMFDLDGIKHIWRVNRLDTFPLGVTFALCFWDIANGILAGIFVHLALLLYKTSKPSFVSGENDETITITPRSGLYYPAAEALEHEIELEISEKSGKNVTLDFGHVEEIDSGVADQIKHSVHYLKSLSYNVSLVNANNAVTNTLLNNNVDWLQQQATEDDNDEETTPLNKV